MKTISRHAMCIFTSLIFGIQVLLEVAANGFQKVCETLSGRKVSLFGQNDQVVRFARSDKRLHHLHRCRERYIKVIGAGYE